MAAALGLRVAYYHYVKVMFGRSYSETVTSVLMRIIMLQCIAQSSAGDEMTTTESSSLRSDAGSAFHVCYPATAKLRGP